MGDRNMKQIDVSTPKYPNTFAIVDDADYDWLNQWKWYVCKKGNFSYALRSLPRNGKQKGIRMHREIMKPGVGFDVDHINHNCLDNRRCNLRTCSRSENSYNQIKSPNKTSKYKGVVWHKQLKKWQTSIMLNRRSVYLGCFVDEIDAARIYDEKAKELFGEFAWTNF